MPKPIEGNRVRKPFADSRPANHFSRSFDRRHFVSAFAAVAATAALPRAARAAKKFEGQTVVFASWGGSFQDAQKAAFCEPFAQETGATVVQAGPISYAKLRAMLESGAPTWDVVDVGLDFFYSGAADKLFDPIDTSIVDVKRIDPRYRHENGVGDIVWSYNLGYSKSVYTEANRPRSWADFFDLNKFPGRRMMRDRVTPMLEVALLADGVSPDKVYPLDVDRAFKKLDTIKKQSVFWSTNSQSQQLLVDGEANMGVIINGRLFDAVQKGANLGIEWNQHIRSFDYLIVPKNVKDRALAMALINQSTLPEAQAKVANLMALAPTNPDAFKYIDDKVKPWLTTNPAFASTGIPLDQAYWQDHLKPLTERWEQWKLS
jgi:putative spermidine/putrescine transport system substrate-binding protein